MNELTYFLTEKGKIAIGWDEIMDDGFKGEAVVMIWRGDGINAQNKALKSNRKMILCPNFYCYFDWKQTFEDDEHGSFGVTPLSKTYSYNPQEVSEASELILGIQGISGQSGSQMNMNCSI